MTILVLAAEFTRSVLSGSVQDFVSIWCLEMKIWHHFIQENAGDIVGRACLYRVSVDEISATHSSYQLQ